VTGKAGPDLGLIVTQPASKRRALLVEDFEELRTLLVVGLRRAGFHVDSAASLAEAAGMSPERYDVLITDLSLGDAFGTELLDLVRARDPAGSCRFLLMTGGGLGPQPPPGVPVLVKPFRIDVLVDAVRRLLAEDGQQA
jgi:DNA-binding NtrC family response regulator